MTKLDIKEFIKKLKELIPEANAANGIITPDILERRINELAGEELI